MKSPKPFSLFLILQTSILVLSFITTLSKEKNTLPKCQCYSQYMPNYSENKFFSSLLVAPVHTEYPYTPQAETSETLM